MSRCQGIGETEGWISKTENFREWNYSVSYIMGIHVTISLSKPIEGSMPKVSPSVNYELWMIVTRQCRFINCNKWSAVVGTADNRRGYACMQAGCLQAISLSSSQFCPEPKIALKNSLLNILFWRIRILTLTSIQYCSGSPSQSN